MWGIHFKNSHVLKKKEDPQIFDLLQLSRHEKQLRDDCIASLADYDFWKRQEGKVKYFSEGRILKRRAEASVHAYKNFRRVRISIFEAYMASLPPVQSSGF